MDGPHSSYSCLEIAILVPLLFLKKIGIKIYYIYEDVCVVSMVVLETLAAFRLR